MAITGRPRSRFGLLIEAPDGARLFRLVLPRWLLAVAASLGALVAICAGAAVYRDHLSLQSERARLADTLSRIEGQQALVDGYRATARDLAAEIGRWRELHARILDPFGPDSGLVARDPGIGGAGAAPVGNAVDHVDRSGDDLAELSRVVEKERDELRALEQFLSRAGKLLATLPSRWPVRGSINSDFGVRLSPWSAVSEFHGGIDIGAATGTAVRSPAPATVVFAGPLPDLGIAIVLDHGNETKSVYGHLSKVMVAADQTVRRGDLIALSGNTGRSSGPHLHYEIQVAGQPINPHTYLWDE